MNSSFESNGSREQFQDTFTTLLEKAREKPIDAIFVLSGGVKKVKAGETTAGVEITDEPSARISSTAFLDPDPRKSLGWGKAKDIATAEIATALGEVQPERAVVIVTSSRSTNNKSRLSDAAVSEAALRRSGVRNEIKRQEQSLDLFTELLEGVRLASENGWKRIVFTTTLYQRPRAEAMLESIRGISEPKNIEHIEQLLAFNANRFNKLNYPERTSNHVHFKETYEYLKANPPQDIEIFFLNAEDGLKHRNPDRYGKLAGEVKQNPLYARKLEQDIRAAEQWRAGDYGKSDAATIAAWRKNELF